MLIRPDCRIPCTAIEDGVPFPDDSFDAVTLVDMLHHTDDIAAVLAEAERVARKCVVIKDVHCGNRLDFWALAFMDWVGNRPYGVRLPYNLAKQVQWQALFQEAGLKEKHRTESLGIYPAPFRLLFERGKHFVALLEITRVPAGV